MLGGAKRFGIAVEAVSWASIVLRVAQFLLFSPALLWRKLTFGVLAGLLFAVAITSGMTLSSR